MKKILAVIAFLSVGALAHADFPRTVDNQPYPPKNKQMVAEAVYMSSVTCVNNAVQGAPIVISTTPVLLYGVVISSPGLGSPTVNLFDSSVSTTNMRSITGPLTGGTATAQFFNYNIVTSSGLTISNAGQDRAPCVSVIYTFR